MLTQEQISYIGEHRRDIIDISNGLPYNQEVMDWLKKTFYRECWTCQNKIKINLRNLLIRYDKQTRI